jgi:S-adenosylmethionine-dependent methyltransferase
VDVENHVNGRLIEFTNRQLKWVAKHVALDGCRVLEIGAGTGSATAALGIAGAIVDGIDIDTRALEIARIRCNLHELPNINLLRMNAVDIDQLNYNYDLILYFATYEHLTLTERKKSLSKAWEMVVPGGLVGFIECPNRLWYYDVHTTFSNFYNWLPDELAIDYAKFYEREGFRTAFEEEARGGAGGATAELARWGRGASYHDIEVALGPIANIEILEGSQDYMRSIDEDLDRWWSHSDEGKYRQLLMKFAPNIPSAFFYPWMEVLMRKPVRL